MLTTENELYKKIYGKKMWNNNFKMVYYKKNCVIDEFKCL